MSITALTTRLRARGTLTQARDGGDASVSVDVGSVHEVENGAGAGQANALFYDEFSIAASGTLDYDLAGALVDSLGNTVVFTAIKEIIVTADAANINNVVIGNGTNPFVGPFSAGTITIALKPGGRFNVSDGYSAAGWAVGAGASDVLKLANSGAGTAVTGSVTFIGEA